MTCLPLPNPEKRQAYVVSIVRKRYWSVPRGLPWIVVPLLGIATFATVDEPNFLIDILCVLPAAICGIFIARLVAARIPAWNEARREDVETRAREEFQRSFETLQKEFRKVIAQIHQFSDAISSASYRVYVERAQAAQRAITSFSHRQLDSFFDDTPHVVLSCHEFLQELIHEVELDPSAITAYQPDLLDQIEHLERRVAAGNVLDSYYACRNLRELFAALNDRDSPFNFAQTLTLLEERAQQCRDQMLSDPARESVWREIQYKDEELQETYRHHQVMEAAAEAEAEAAREQAEASREQVTLAEERNELLREQRNAQRAVAVGAAATAWYTRKTANAVREIADRPSGAN
jgi:hypothetical protein